MSGYAATARIERVRPRLAAAPMGTDVAAFARIATGRLRDEHQAPGPELADTAVRDSLVERMETIRERWAQLTFYLFDADGWR